MNTLHYPSLELCKKLTEISFPKTENYIDDKWYISDFKETYVCPSVMEMLDVIPENLFLKEKKTDEFYPYYPLYITYSDSGKKVEYRSIVYSYRDSVKMDCMLQNHCLVKFEDKLPNALAEMVLWLNENKYISFSK